MQTGTYRVDFFKIGSDGKPMILHALSLEKPGAWETELPKGLGQIIVLGFVDATGNGPDPTEPSGYVTGLDVQADPLTGITLAVKDGAENPYAIGAPALPPTEGVGTVPPAGVGAAPGAAPTDPAAAGAAPTDAAAAAAPTDAAAAGAAPTDAAAAAAPAAPKTP